MKKNYRNYFFLSVMLVLISLIVGNCGGGSDTGAVPNVSGNPSQTQNLVTKDVSGYIFWAGSIPSPEGGNTERFIVLDNPLTGEENFLTELSSYLQEEAPEAWASSEVQAIYSQLTSEMSGWKPLKEWNSNANLYTIYQDSKQTSPFQVGTDGYFSGTVLVSSADDNVCFEVIVGDNEKCYSVEAISSAEINSSETNATELISCPQIILNFPGWCTIFEVRSKPDAINLKDAGLSFTLNDANLGCVSPPVYLKCGGKRNYEVAYGIFYANPGIATPSSSTITAQTTTGLILNIFTEVIGSCASIEGHVGGTGVFPLAGFVYSLGCDAFDCLDEAGNYKLNAVFKGHFREVVAVYWVQVNGQLVKHREERTIDFFNGNLTGFDLPEIVQPTPTFPPATSIYYRKISSKILDKKIEWMQELGPELGTEKTVDWLNNQLPEEPLPDSIAEAIDTAIFCPPDSMEYTYKSGLSYVIFGESYLPEEEDSSSSNDKEALLNSSQSWVPTTVKNKNVLLLGPIFEDWWNNDKIFTDLKADFESKGFTVTSKFAGGGKLRLEEVGYDDDPGIHMYEYNCIIEPDATDLVRPDDFKNLDEYGVIYINAHGGEPRLLDEVMYIQACPFYLDPNGALDEDLIDFVLGDKKYYKICAQPFKLITFPGTFYTCYYNSILLTKAFYDDYIARQDLSDSLVYFNGCFAWSMHEKFGAFSNAKVFVGTDKAIILKTWQYYAYYFFSKMLADTPMSARDAYNRTIFDYAYYELDTVLKIDTGDSNENDSTYLPADTTVIVERQ